MSSSERTAVEDTSQKHTKIPQQNIAGEDGEKKKGSHVALLLVDVVNDLSFEGNETIVKRGKEMAPRVKKLAAECRSRDIPVVYCNDNWSQWRCNWDGIIDHCLSSDSAGREMSQMLLPEKEDYIVIKPKHSAFFSTTLDVLLHHLSTRTLIIAGLAGNICVLFTANDAYMRDYAVMVVEDCTASKTDEENKIAMEMIRTNLKGEVQPLSEMDWDKITHCASKKRKDSPCEECGTSKHSATGKQDK
eukprot:TRINITY_DN5198_c0_g1_i1.p1 TRINITY_DN5198_c0_g1~~TRINITY_DN5198_c0_g1_i1.p1  ORF type:complete len:246 (-),score=61.53 TRINITY_DN5198_c0_g1_i1:471-1208(-)